MFAKLYKTSLNQEPQGEHRKAVVRFLHSGKKRMGAIETMIAMLFSRTEFFDLVVCPVVASFTNGILVFWTGPQTGLIHWPVPILVVPKAMMGAATGAGSTTGAGATGSGTGMSIGIPVSGSIWISCADKRETVMYLFYIRRSDIRCERKSRCYDEAALIFVS